MVDPMEHAAGKGIEQLKNAGIDVEVGVCEKQAKQLNAWFIKYASTGKCWVVLKWAQSLDGKLAWRGQGRRWISGEQSRKDAHKLRRRVGGILVGVNTVIADDPLLTARPARGRKLTRIVVDSRLRIGLDCKLLNSVKDCDVVIVTTQDAIDRNREKVESIKSRGAELLVVPEISGRCDLEFMLDELSGRGISQLLVEGGAEIIGSFLKAGLGDEVCVYISSEISGQGGCVDISGAMAEMTEPAKLCDVDIKRFGDDVRISGFLK